MQNFIIARSILVELNIATVSQGANYNFQDVPELRGKLIYGIEAFSDSHVAKTPFGNTVVANGSIDDVLLTLSVGTDEQVANIPYYTLVSANNGGLIRQFANLPVNLTKSYVKLVNNTITNGHSLLFNFYYR